MKNQARRLLDVIRQFQLGPQAAAAGDEPLRLAGADTAVQPRLSMAPR
ncbi:hypothetical protein ACQKEU_24540 [Acidovorax sp. NPDC077664]